MLHYPKRSTQPVAGHGEALVLAWGWGWVENMVQLFLFLLLLLLLQAIASMVEVLLNGEDRTW